MAYYTVANFMLTKYPWGYMGGVCPREQGDHFQTGDICYNTPRFQKFEKG